MTKAYHQAQHIIKEHVNAEPGDMLITSGFGMTGELVKFQRMLNLKVPENNIAGKFVYNGKKTDSLYYPYGTSLKPYIMVSFHC